MNIRTAFFIISLAAVRVFAADTRCEMKSGEKVVKLNTSQCYAHYLSKLASDYLKPLEAQVSGQEDLSDRLISLHSAAQRTNANLAMEADRDAAIQVWIRHLVDDNTRISTVLDDVARLASSEFHATRDWYSQELDEKSSYLATLNNLEINTKKVAGLKELLDELAQPTDLKKLLGDLAAFGQDTKTQLQQAECALAKSRLGFFNGESTRLADAATKPGLSPAQKKLLADRKAAADDQIKTLKEKAGKCAAQ